MRIDYLTSRWRFFVKQEFLVKLRFKQQSLFRNDYFYT